MAPEGERGRAQEREGERERGRETGSTFRVRQGLVSTLGRAHMPSVLVGEGAARANTGEGSTTQERHLASALRHCVDEKPVLLRNLPHPPPHTRVRPCLDTPWLTTCFSIPCSILLSPPPAQKEECCWEVFKCSDWVERREEDTKAVEHGPNCVDEDTNLQRLAPWLPGKDTAPVCCSKTQ